MSEECRERAAAEDRRTRRSYTRWWGSLLMRRVNRLLGVKSFGLPGGTQYWVQPFERGLWACWELPRSVFSVGIQPCRRIQPLPVEEFGSLEEQMKRTLENKPTLERTWEDVEAAGFVVEGGVIRSLGKFEGEPWWAVLAWDAWLEGATNDMFIDGVLVSILQPEPAVMQRWDPGGGFMGVKLFETERRGVKSELLTEAQMAELGGAAVRARPGGVVGPSLRKGDDT